MHQLDGFDWGVLIGELRVRLLLSQREIAERCKVSPQAVSAWRRGHRAPDMHGRRRLIGLAREAGIRVGAAGGSGGVSEIAEHLDAWEADESELREVVELFLKLSGPVRREVMGYVRFRAAEERGRPPQPVHAGVHG